ncbi:MAG: hypothetical protein WB502_14410 [Thermoactinomyces sp.]
MKKTWITAREISQFCYCPEQWRLGKLYRQGLVQADRRKVRIKEKHFQRGILYHRKKAFFLWMKTKGYTWGMIGTGAVLFLLLWLVKK